MQSKTGNKKAIGKQNVSVQGTFPESQFRDPDYGGDGELEKVFSQLASLLSQTKRNLREEISHFEKTPACP